MGWIIKLLEFIRDELNLTVIDDFMAKLNDLKSLKNSSDEDPVNTSDFQPQPHVELETESLELKQCSRFF